MQKIYQNIDMEKTGFLIKQRVEEAGYTVKELQKMLHLSCPQPIYRWYKGKILPSVEHLYFFSKLLQVHMEELIVPSVTMKKEIDMTKLSRSEQRIYLYWMKLKAVA